MVDKGVVWSVGRIFSRRIAAYQFNLLPEDGHKRPAFINLQQFHAEAYLVDRVQELPAIDLRWRNKVAGLEAHNDHVVLTIETPEGPYLLARPMSWPATARGRRCGRWSVRNLPGKVFEDQFPDRGCQNDGGISDRALVLVRPPPFHAGRSALLHSPDDIWRIDLQLHPTPIPRSRSGRKTCGRGSRACSGTRNSSSNGSRSTNSVPPHG